MKLYTSIGPNPHVVRMFMAEKSAVLPTQEIDLRDGENRRAPYVTNVNRRGQSPALELDDGSHICEITAICEYIDEKFDGPSMIGDNAEQRAETRMWVRRIDLSVCEPMANGYRYSEGLGMFKDRFRCIPQAADGLKAIAKDNLAWFDEELGDNSFLCGDRFSLADIMLFCFVKFGNNREQPLDQQNTYIAAWMERVGARPSASV